MASRWPLRLALADSISFSTSALGEMLARAQFGIRLPHAASAALVGPHGEEEQRLPCSCLSLVLYGCCAFVEVIGDVAEDLPQLFLVIHGNQLCGNPFGGFGENDLIAFPPAFLFLRVGQGHMETSL